MNIDTNKENMEPNGNTDKHPNDVESQNATQCDANDENLEQTKNQSNPNKCNDSVNDDDIKSEESNENHLDSNYVDDQENKQNHSNSNSVEGNDDENEQNHSYSKSINGNQNKDKNQNQNPSNSDDCFESFFNSFNEELHAPPPQRKKRKSIAAGIQSQGAESKTPRKRRRLTTSANRNDDVRPEIDEVQVPILANNKKASVAEKEAARRYYDVDPKTRARIKRIFEHFTEEEARQQIENIIRIIDDPKTEERARRRFRNTLIGCIECCEENNNLLDICRRVYDKQVRSVVNGTSFISKEKLYGLRKSSFAHLGETTVGKISFGLAKYFNADLNVVLLPLLAFTSTFLCHVTMKTSVKFDTNCNVYAFVVASPGAKKSPVTSSIQKYAAKTIEELAALCEKNGHYWIKGILNCIQSANCSLSRNCQLTEQASGIQLNVSDELAHASGTFQLNKKADESEGIAFLTTAYDCKAIQREFCDAKYISCIPRAYMSMIVLSQPHLIKAFLSGIKAQMGYCSRNLISFSNVKQTKTQSVRVMDYGQLSLWDTRTMENVLDSTFKSLGVLLFSNLISPTCKLILKYSKECALIMVAFHHVWQKVREEYSQNQDSEYYDEDFTNSLSKGLTQIDKLIANLFFHDEFASNPIPNTYKMDDEFYKQNCINGGYNNKTYIIKNTTLLYAGMEILIDAKIGELNVKRKAIPWINFDVHDFIKNHVLVNNEVPPRLIHKSTKTINKP